MFIALQILNCWEMENAFSEPVMLPTRGKRFVFYTLFFIIYARKEKREIIPVQNDILTLYARKKTNWTVVDQYFDESEHQNSGEQKQLMNLLENRNKYNLLLIHNLNDIHWRTANFCKIREQLKIDIYSLQEGFLKYDKET